MHIQKTIGLAILVILTPIASISAQTRTSAVNQSGCRTFVDGFYKKYEQTRSWQEALDRHVFGAELWPLLAEELAWQNDHPKELDLDFDPILNTNGDPYDRYVVGSATADHGHCFVGIYGVNRDTGSRELAVTAEVTRQQGRFVFVNFHYGRGKSDPDENLLGMLKNFASERAKLAK